MPPASGFGLGAASVDAAAPGAQPGQDVASGDRIKAVEQHTQLGELSGCQRSLDLVAAQALIQEAK